MLEKTARRAAIGLNNKYLRVGQSAQNRLFGIPPMRAGPSLENDLTPLQMLVSHQGKIHNGRTAVVLLGVLTLVLGIILSSIPWLDYIVYMNIKLWNGTLSYYYWQKPGVMRLTKVFIFNVTNPEEFLHSGQKPHLQEVGPFVFKEDMMKMNVKFHDNGTVTFQHRKILEFVPELSLSKDMKLVVPNIPLLSLTSKSAILPLVMRIGLSIGLKTLYKQKIFLELTPEELLFGIDEPLTALAHKLYPMGKRPPSKMGLLITRNSSLLSDVATIFTGHTGMKDFGLMNRLNGLDHLPQWPEAPCNSIKASEGSLFPPKDITKSDVVHVWDKDICRAWPLRYRGDTYKDGVLAGIYTPDEVLGQSDHPDNQCYCAYGPCPPDGMQDISPCQFGAPVLTSFPHFLGVKDPKIHEAIDGLAPDEEKHGSVVLINPKIGVPIQARMRAQLNLRVTHTNLTIAKNFPSIIFPICWVEEGAEEVPSHIFFLIYLSTTVADWLGPAISYGTVVTGACILVLCFVRAYNNVVFTRENIELGKAKLRRGSSFLVNGQHRLLILRDSYSLLHNHTTAETSFEPDAEASP